MSCWASLTESSIRAAALERFPTGVAREDVERALPDSTTPPLSLVWWEHQDNWVWKRLEDGSIAIVSGESASIFGRYWIWIQMLFDDGKLREIRVGRGEVHL